MRLNGVAALALAASMAGCAMNAQQLRAEGQELTLDLAAAPPAAAECIARNGTDRVRIPFQTQIRAEAAVGGATPATVMTFFFAGELVGVADLRPGPGGRGSVAQLRLKPTLLSFEDARILSAFKGC